MENDDTSPVRLIEDADTGHRFLIYATAQGLKVELRHDGDALWMTQAQMAGLFGRDVSVISRHIANILEEGELSEESNLHFMQIARSTKPVALYSLDMVISVGYRVSSGREPDAGGGARVARGCQRARHGPSLVAQGRYPAGRRDCPRTISRRPN